MKTEPPKLVNINKLDVYEFGEKLLRTRDLDPVYVVLWEASLAPGVLRKWLLAYWCFYHVGTSSWIADATSSVEYWGRMETAAGSKEYPRAHERRHFRGNNALKSVAYLKSKGLSTLFAPLIWYVPTPVEKVMKEVQTWVGFGPWIAFKVADMLERLALSKVEFNDGAMFLFDSPAKGANMLWKEENPEVQPNSKVGSWAVKRILDTLGQPGVSAPPRYDRPLNSQEAETILCKWKSHRGGHYTIGEDILAVRRGLATFGRSHIAQALYVAGRKVDLW